MGDKVGTMKDNARELSIGGICWSLFQLAVDSQLVFTAYSVKYRSDTKSMMGQIVFCKYYLNEKFQFVFDCIIKKLNIFHFQLFHKTV